MERVTKWRVMDPIHGQEARYIVGPSPKGGEWVIGAINGRSAEENQKNAEIICRAVNDLHHLERFSHRNRVRYYAHDPHN